MAQFITRVELHGATREDYDKLHKLMEERGFTRTIETTEGVFELPTAEYHCSGNITTAQVRDIAMQTADQVKRGSWVLVSNYSGLVFHLGFVG